MVHRIGIVGSAGTGKTTLGINLAAALGVPFLEAKTITREILKRDGYLYSSGIPVERFLAQGTRQDEIFQCTVDLEDQCAEQGFVTDRTFIDLAAYCIAELHEADPMKVAHYITACQDRSVNGYTHLLFCPWSQRPLLDNQKRTLNPWAQFVIHGLEMGLLDLWGLKYHVVDVNRNIPDVLAQLGK